MALSWLLTDPRRFYEQAELGGAVWIVTAGAVASVLPLIPLYGGLSLALSGIGVAVVGGAFGVGILSTVFSVYLEWVVVAGAFHLVCVRLEARGEFRELFRYVGWGFFPVIVRAVVVAAMATVVIDSVPANPSIDRLMATVGGEFQTYSRVIIFVTRLWQAVLWTFAVAAARDLSLRRAGLVVSVPTLGFFVYNLAVAAGVV